MPANIQIHEMSALATGVDKTSGVVRFKAADNATVDSADPLVIPAADSIYSYTKKLRLYMESPPSVNISNLRAYSDGNNGMGEGVGITVKNLGVTWGDNFNTAQSGGADLFGKTSGSPLDIDVTDSGEFLPARDNTYIGDLIELQMSVASTATQGAISGETLTFAYDEI